MHITWTRKLIRQERKRAGVGDAFDTTILPNNLLRFSWQCPGTTRMDTVYVHQDGRIVRKAWKRALKPLSAVATHGVPF